MIIFIDDSGDPGFKFDRGSTSHFVIAMVIFDDPLEAEKTALAIKQLRRDLGFSDDSEFKFFKTQKRFRVQFLETISPFNFNIRALVVDKKNIYSSELRNNKNSFYSYFIKEVIKHNGGTIFNAKIRIDGSGDRIFRKNFLTYLRKELNYKTVPIMKNSRMVDSKSDVLIQLADMIAGSILRSCNPEKADRHDYRKIIEHRIQDIWNFQ